MSLNTENIFIECADIARVSAAVEAYLKTPTSDSQPDWGLPSSFEPVLAKEKKRKIAISFPMGGWTALVESKEVVDFALAKRLSEICDAHILVIQISESSGSAGYALVKAGKLLGSQFYEEDEDPLNTIRRTLKKHGILFEPVLFREAGRGHPDWTIKQKT